MNKRLRGALAFVGLPMLHAEENRQIVKLPKALIIGDSISIGYTPYVTQLLKNEAVARRNAGNAQHTGVGIEKLEQWLGKEKRDVIHFNLGFGSEPQKVKKHGD